MKLVEHTGRELCSHCMRITNVHITVEDNWKSYNCSECGSFIKLEELENGTQS